MKEILLWGQLFMMLLILLAICLIGITNESNHQELVKFQKNQVQYNNFIKWHEDDVDPSEMDEYNYNSEVK